MRRLVRDNGLGLFFGGIFLAALVGQALVGHADFNHSQVAHQGEPITLARYLLSSDFGADVAENWQSEYLQFTLYILGTVWLLQRGSPESKEPGKAGGESDESQRIGEHATARSPRWARAGGWRTRVYGNSLVLVMGAIWLASWAVQSVTGRVAYDAQQLDHQEAAVSWLHYVGTSDFWNRTLVPEGPPDDRFVYLSDVLPTAWQAVEYADVPDGGSVLVLGLGPIGEMSCRIAQHRGVEHVMAIDLVPERLERARAHGVDAIDLRRHDDIPAYVRDQTGGRGPDSVIDAVGMEAHGAPIGKLAHRLAGLLPDAAARKVIETAGIDRLSALHLAIELVQRGGTVSISGVYGGAVSPMPLIQMFDKQINVRMGQANVKRWIDDLMPLVSADDDPLGVEGFATHRVPLAEAPHAYEIFQKKQDGAFKVLLQP